MANPPQPTEYTTQEQLTALGEAVAILAGSVEILAAAVSSQTRALAAISKQINGGGPE